MTLECTKGHSATTGDEVANVLAKQGSLPMVEGSFPVSAAVLKSRIKRLYESRLQER